MNRFVALLLLFGLLSGCSSAPVYYTPSPIQLGPITEFSSSGEITLVNDQPKADEVLYCSTLDFYANYNKWTDVAIQLIEREITKRGMTVATTAPKSMKIAVKNVETTVRFTHVTTNLVMAVDTASGYKKDYFGMSLSIIGANVATQTDEALMSAVAEMLNDPEIVKYIQQ